MDYFLTETQAEIQNLARQIAREKVKPVRAELDEKEEFPWEIMKVLAQSDLFGVYIPEEYGGLGGGAFENCLAVEELIQRLHRRLGQLRGQRPGRLSHICFSAPKSRKRNTCPR